ncbi:MAG: cyanophycinase [Anaerolineae bacterium]|nr:cyanophycinase [Anaerolineae bacterium]
MTRHAFISLLALLTLALSIAAPTAAQGSPETTLILVGGGYSDTYPGIAETMVARAQDGVVRIVVLPTTYTSNAESITEAELALNLEDAEYRRVEIEGACQRAAPAGVTCTAVTAPVFVRDDALDPANAALFDAATAVFILGGDQGAAMEVLVGTPVEAALAAAYARGAVFAGTSAGCGTLSATMIADYNANFARANALDFGASMVWNSADRRGLSFGVQDAIVDQHFFQRSRVGRLLEAISRPDVPHVGIGVDAYTGVHLRGGTLLEDVIGLYTVAVFDAATYHAAEGVRYRGPNHTLSLRNVLVHLLAPGDFGYDLATRQHTLGAAPPVLERSLELALPTGAGPLLLAGNLSQATADHPVLVHFAGLVEGDDPLLVVAAGYPNDRSAQRAADRLAEALGLPAEVVVLSGDDDAPLSIDGSYAAIAFIARDQSLLAAERLGALGDAWRSGTPLLADNAAAAVLGVAFSAHGPTPAEADAVEIAVQKSFWLGQTDIRAGLGLLDATIEPQVQSDDRWGRLFSLAYNRPDVPALGLTDDTALEITQAGARVVGQNVVFVLDLRAAQLDLGENAGFVMANGMLDVFAAGDAVVAQVADAGAVPERAPTPVLASPTPLPTPTAAATVVPTVASSATPSPAPQPSPAPTMEAPPTLSGGSIVLIGTGVGGLAVAVLAVVWVARRGFGRK